jgi:hypothetical protein
LQECHPEAHHTLYDDEALREFVRTNMGRDATRAFDSLIPLAYRADLGRYALLLERGGIYADLSVHFFQPVCNLEGIDRIHVFRDGFSAAPWIVSISIIACPPGMQLFQLAIDQIIENCDKGNYGVNPLCPTGPNLFGKLIAASVPLEKIICGESRRINRNDLHSYAYLSAAGDVLAVNVKLGAGLRSLGVAVNEDYNRIYAAGNIYGELAKRLIFKKSDYLREGWVDPSSSGKGFWSMAPASVLRGPFTPLGPAGYKATFFLRSVSPAVGSTRLLMEVVGNHGRDILKKAEGTLRSGAQEGVALSLAFTLDRIVRDVEIRLRFLDRADIDFKDLRIERSTPSGSGTH